jgi:hypothetical protein
MKFPRRKYQTELLKSEYIGNQGNLLPLEMRTLVLVKVLALEIQQAVVILALAQEQWLLVQILATITLA